MSLPSWPLRSPHGWRPGYDPTGFETFVDDGLFDPLDGDGRVVDAQDARPFAGGRAHPPGELRKIICLVKTIQRSSPVTAIDKFIPFGDQVIDRAA